MNKTISIILAATVLTTVLSGCGSKEFTPAQSTTLPSQSDSEQLTPSTDVQNSASVPSGVSEAQGKLTEFESDFGYIISYEADNFDYRRAEGYDEFVLKSDAVDKPFVFISISNVGAEFAEQAKVAALGDSPELCIIGQAQIEGQCSETEEAWADGKTIRKTYVCPLASGDILLIETQWYTEQGNDLYAAQLREIINSIKISD